MQSKYACITNAIHAYFRLGERIVIFEQYVNFIVIFTISGKMGLSCVKTGHTIRKTGSNRSGESGYSGI